MSEQHFDVVVIGGGSGLTAAYFAQQDEKNVALVDRLPAMENGLKAQAVRETIHIHPTLPEMIKTVFDSV